MTVLDLISLASFVETMKVGSSVLGFIVVFQNLVVYCVLFSAQTPLPQEGDVFTEVGGLPGGSSDVSPFQLAGMTPSGSHSRHERTQHCRPAEGLEKSVLHNEWAKGKVVPFFGLHCCRRLSISVMYSRVCCG